MFDIKITGGTIIDGSGARGYRADVGIAGDSIVEIGSDLAHGYTEICAEGLVVCPGFIDTHSHSDLRLLRADPPLAKISQGVTTELLGQDGLGVAPVVEDTLPQLRALTSGLLGPHPAQDWDWRSFEEYLDRLEGASLPNNQAVLASHGPLRLLHVGAADRAATPRELELMKETLQEVMEQGAWGLSTGLIYPPASYAPSEELTALTQVVSDMDGVFVVHLRDEGYYLQEALGEVIDACRRSGCRLHISHLQAYGRANWHLLPRALNMIAKAGAEGMVVTCDRYPYLAGSTVLTAVLPTWVLDGGPQECLNRLSDPRSRARIHEAFTQELHVWHNRALSVGWENITVSWVAGEKNQDVVGRSIQQLSDERGMDPVDVVCDLLLEEDLQVTMISHYGSEDNLELILQHPSSAVATDGIYGGKPHPRLWGTYPRLLSRYVRETKVLTVEEAVYKITSLPARIIGLRDRGLILPGMKADIVVFDPREVAELSTYNDPERPPKGFHLVMVNGTAALRSERYLPEAADPGSGCVLRRS